MRDQRKASRYPSSLVGLVLAVGAGLLSGGHANSASLEGPNDMRVAPSSWILDAALGRTRLAGDSQGLIRPLVGQVVDTEAGVLMAEDKKTKKDLWDIFKDDVRDDTKKQEEKKKQEDAKKKQKKKEEKERTGNSGSGY